MFTPGGHNIAFGCGAIGTSHMELTSTGRLGIGTTSPSNLLTIHAGTSTDGDVTVLRLNNDETALADGDGVSMMFGLGTDFRDVGKIGVFSSDSSHDQFNMRFAVRNASNTMTERMRIVGSSGNVGIGNTNPIYGKLSINNTTSGDHVLRLSQQMPTTAVYIEMLTGNAPALVINDVGASGSNAGFVSFGAGNTPDAHLHISSSRQIVGSSTASLHIEGSGSEVVAVDGTQGRLFSVTDEMSGSIFSANTIAGVPVIDVKSNYDVLLDPYGNGKVGIGTNAPSAPFHVLNNAVFAGDVSLSSGKKIVLDGDGGNSYITDGDANDIYFIANGYTMFRIRQHYDTRIGHPRPTDDDVHDLGSAGLRWDNIYATNSTIQTSDERSKENITPSSLGLSFINQLNPVEYKWKDYDQEVPLEMLEGQTTPIMQTVTKTFKRKHYGLIAQEVEKVLEDNNISTNDFAPLIKDNLKDDDGNETGEHLYGMRYSEYVGILIKAIQELTAKVNNLQAQISGSSDFNALKTAVSGSS